MSAINTQVWGRQWDDGKLTLFMLGSSSSSYETESLRKWAIAHGFTGVHTTQLLPKQWLNYGKGR